MGKQKKYEISATSLPENAQDIILDTISCGVFTVDTNWRITSYNKAIAQLTGIPLEDAIGRPCREILRGDICTGKCALRETLSSGKPIINRSFELVDSNGKRKPVSISTAVFRDNDGKVIGGLETVRDLTLIEELRKKISLTYRLNDIISRNHTMGAIFELLPRIARTSSTVLIEGESGTGKELAARAIHSLSERKEGPFIALNCAALPDQLLESELFGYRKGAFTDAKYDKKGRVDLACGGTLFLDEIGDISPALQVKLLRFLQDHVYEPLGSQEQLQADVRIVAATNKKLNEQVKSGLFREDLYFRINVIKIELPPLRNRLEDIPLLAECFIRRNNAVQGKTIKGISHDALNLLMGHDFPGNIRELENIIEYAFIMCEEDMILPNHLPPSVKGIACSTAHPSNPSYTLKMMETAFYSNLLEQHGKNCEEAARSLGINKATFYRKLKKLGIETPARKRE